MLDIAFHRRIRLNTARDLLVFGWLTKLATLEIRNLSDAVPSPDDISHSLWKAFVSAVPAVDSL